MQKRTLAVLAVATAAGALFPFGMPKAAQAAPGVISYNALVFAPLPIEQPGTLAAGGTVTMCIQPQQGGAHVAVGAIVFLSIDSGLFTAPPAPGGSATAKGTPLTGTPTAFTTVASCSFANAESSGTVMDAVPITYTGPNPVPINGRDVIVAAQSASDVTSGQCNGAGVCNTGTYVFSPVASYAFLPAPPIAATGSLAAGQSVTFTVTAMDSTGHAVPGAFLDISLSSTTASHGSATVVNSFTGNSTQRVSNLPTRLGTTSAGSASITYTAANPLPPSGDVDTITIQNHPHETVENTTTYTYSGSGPPPASGPYTAVPPFRVCDTRPVAPGIAANQCNAAGQGPIGSGATRVITLANLGGVPGSGVIAVVVNVTAIAPSKLTFLTLFPDGSSLPHTSNLNPTPGSVRANLVEVAVSSAVKLDLFNAQGTINVAVDVEGYVSSTSTGLYNASAPVRICDTRVGSGIPANRCNTGGPSPIGSGATLTFNVNGSGSPVPGTGVSAVVFNLTAIAPSTGTVLTAFAGGTTRPTASNLNLAAHTTVPNRVIVPVTCGGGNCTVSIWNSVGSVNIAVDIDGYFITSSGAAFTGLTPARVCDTRFGNSNDAGCARAVVGAGRTLNIDIAGIDGVPVENPGGTSPVAVVINVTAVNPTNATFVTAFPGLLGRPNASDLNVPAGTVSTNLVVVAVGADGTINLFNDLGNVNLIVDVLGYYS